MDRVVVTCEGCGHPCTVRVRDDGTYVLPTDTGECEQCGCTEFLQVSGDVIGND
ncbi:hypothetical protein [Haladaptatus sp. DYF46]|uniref:hypothetical protein n=1 Tax=Haladaptatus sp. DYF46 TaxID=2886041 RepID=UPI001E483E39|nr:hypothetical protein [Haladaptatus sp. DYF46]